jgi:hypothetical protein
MYHLDDSTPAVQQRILSVGRGEPTLKEIYDEWKQLPVTYVMTREKAPIYRQDKGGTTA